MEMVNQDTRRTGSSEASKALAGHVVVGRNALDMYAFWLTSRR
jgi:hypothetical protein